MPANTVRENPPRGLPAFREAAHGSGRSYYRRAVITWALIRPVTGPEPYRAAIASAATWVAAASASAPWASISLRIGVPWQYPMATESASGAVLSRVRFSTLAAPNPAVRSCVSRAAASWCPCGVRARNIGGSCGYSAATDLTTASANSFSSMRSQTLNRKRPPGLRTRNASANARGLSGKNITPNWHTTASNMPSGKGSAWASACRQVTRSDESWLDAWSSIDWLRSVATMETSRGRVDTRARVTTPVPAAVSSRLPSRRPASLAARSSAYGAKIIGPRYRSYKAGMEPPKTRSAVTSKAPALLAPSQAHRRLKVSQVRRGHASIHEGAGARDPTYSGLQGGSPVSSDRLPTAAELGSCAHAASVVACDSTPSRPRRSAGATSAERLSI